MGQEVEFRVKTEDVTQGMGIYTPDMTLVAQVQAMPGYTNALVHTFENWARTNFFAWSFAASSPHDMVNEFAVLEVAQWLMQHSKVKQTHKKTHTLL